MSEAPLTLADFAAMEVTRLKGVGPKRAEALANVDVVNVLDLLTYYPRRYVDRTREALLGELAVGEEATVVVRVAAASTRRTRKGQSMTTVDATDAAGSRLKMTFFNQPWRERQLQPGSNVVVFGRLDVFRGARQMTSPVVDLIGDKTGRIVPVYPQSERSGLTSSEIGDLVSEILRRSARRGFDDPLPDGVRADLGLVPRGAALFAIHAPESLGAMQVARKRLVFDELLRVQLALVQRKRQLERAAKGISHVVTGLHLDAFLGGLPFPLTGAQQRVIAEVQDDLAKPAPMHRLLQGDVGSGKTVVAVATLLCGVQGGYQGALMAPTEVLAEQHFAGVSRMLGELSVPDPATLVGERPLRVALLTNRTTAAERRKLISRLQAGEIEIVIGTHALIQDAVTFANLGVVVIDEQHRFGVEQRASLRAKTADGTTPDVLVMTATPIPRTAAMTVYGDLDVSVLDELPPGRTPIETIWASTPAGEDAAWQAVRDSVAEGRQAYVVAPLVEESDKMEVASAEETYAQLNAAELAGLSLGLLHGRVNAAEKDQVMARFRAGEIDVLVATTVIEVGVDVPNATVMVIVDADRFGIAQLHQLRGRVGRGAHRSVCYLLSRPGPDGNHNPVAEERLSAMVRTTDGFELAEVDLELRGEGTLMGERQKGRNDLKLASLRRDRDSVERARAVALELVSPEGTLDDHPGLDAEVKLFLGPEAADFLLKS